MGPGRLVLHLHCDSSIPIIIIIMLGLQLVGKRQTNDMGMEIKKSLSPISCGGGVKVCVVANYEDTAFISVSTIRNTCMKLLYLPEKGKKFCIPYFLFHKVQRGKKTTDASS
jgi:hypothetical protein